MTFKHDSGWAWMIVLASSLSCFVNGISLYSMGITHMALMDKFQASRTKTSSVVAVSSSLMSMAAPIASLIINKTNCATCHLIGGLMTFVGQGLSFFMNSLEGLIITYGIIGGLGQSLCLNAAIIVIGYNFSRFRALATGIAIGGCGIGMFCGPPIIRSFFDEYGADGMFLLQGGISAHMFAFGLVMRPSPHEQRISEKVEGGCGMCINLCKENILSAYMEFKVLYSNLAFLFFGIVVFTWNFSVSTFLMYQPSISTSLGVASPQQAALMITAFGSTNTLGRYIIGCSTGEFGLDPMIVHIGQTAIAGVLTLLFPLFYDTFMGHLAFSAILGLYTGGLNVQFSPITYDLVGVEHYASGFGVVLTFAGLGYLLGPPIIGMVLDRGGSNSTVYAIIGTVFLAGTVCNIISGALAKRYAPAIDDTPGDFLISIDESLLTESVLRKGNGSQTLMKQFETTAVGLSLTNLYQRSLERLTHHRVFSASSPHIAV